MVEFKRIQDATTLPPEWDELADNYFQQTKFLLHTEKHNPCSQRYYICIENGKMISAAIIYSLRLDILTFANIKSPIKMNIVGIPCSVSSQGIFGEIEGIKALKKHIYEHEKGLVLFFNLEDKPISDSFATGKTLPTIVFTNNYSNRDDYVASLRSNYRRRLKLINKENKDLRFEKKSCSDFTKEMHNQYLSVYKRSSGKLEKLTHAFFQNLPPEFTLTVCLENNITIGWNIALDDQKNYYFFLGGIDYKQNKKNNTYLRLLSSLINDGIEKKAEFIELGQTAEIPKMRMGGKPKTLYMEAHHSNSFFNKLIKICSPLLEYKPKLENTNALKNTQ